MGAILLPVNGLALSDELVVEAVEMWKDKNSGGNFDEPENELRFKQKSWDLPLADKTFNTLLNDADQISRARLLASSRPESGSWLSVIPNPSLGTHLNPEELRISIALRVGSTICEPHKCRCGRQADPLGHPLVLSV